MSIMGGFAFDFGHVVDPIYQILRIHVSIYVLLMQGIFAVVRVVHPMLS